MSKVWFITGAGRGLGHAFAVAALRRGDRVAATARDARTLQQLADEYPDSFAAFEVDVTDRASVFAAVDAAAARFEGLDVVVNNAGYGLFGAIEELSEDDLRTQFDVNVMGPLHVAHAALPVMRDQGSGHIVQISSVAGLSAIPQLGGYCASKWALEAMSESLSQEVAPFGIKVTIVEPSAYATDWGGSSAVHASPLAAYDAARAFMAEATAAMPADFAGSAEGAANALLRLVDADEPPLRAVFGHGATEMVEAVYESRLDALREGRALAESAQR